MRRSGSRTGCNMHVAMLMCVFMIFLWVCWRKLCGRLEAERRQMQLRMEIVKLLENIDIITPEQKRSQEKCTSSLETNFAPSISTNSVNSNRTAKAHTDTYTHISPNDDNFRGKLKKLDNRSQPNKYKLNMMYMALHCIHPARVCICICEIEHHTDI